MCETFNAWILAARHKSIMAMYEEIRTKLMQRIQVMNEFAKTWIYDISPITIDRFEKK